MIDGNPMYIEIPDPFIDMDIVHQFQKKSKELAEYLPIFQNLIRDYTLLIGKKKELIDLGGYKVNRIRDWFRCCYLESDQCHLRGIVGKLCCQSDNCNETDTLLCLTCCCCSCWMMALPNILKNCCPCLDTPCKMCCPCLSNDYQNPSRDKYYFKLTEPRHDIGMEIDQIYERIFRHQFRLRAFKLHQTGNSILDLEVFLHELKILYNRIKHFQEPLFNRKFIPLLVNDVRLLSNSGKQEDTNSIESDLPLIKKIRRFEENTYDFLNGYSSFCLRIESTAYEKAIKKYNYSLGVIDLAYSQTLLRKINKDPASLVLEYLDIFINPTKEITEADLFIHDEDKNEVDLDLDIEDNEFI